MTIFVKDCRYKIIVNQCSSSFCALAQNSCLAFHSFGKETARPTWFRSFLLNEYESHQRSMLGSVRIDSMDR